ncbi:MAG: universal stress protein [Planctomycetales bacterium]|nr:universal stress protein [Planctomycetales bacterium]
MFERILFAVDGWPPSGALLLQIRRLLSAESSELTFLTVVPDSGDGPAEAAKLEALRRRARGDLDALRSLLAWEGLRAETAIRTGDPAGEILRAVEETRASLVVLERRGHTGRERLLRDSLAQGVLRGSRVPVLLVDRRPAEAGGGAGPRSFERILVAHDGSPASARILPLAESLARLHGAELILIHAVLAPEAAPRFEDPRPGEPVSLSALGGECERLAGEGIAARLRVGSAAASAEILMAAREESADLIALTTHGRGGHSRDWIGSVAEQVLHRSPFPLLVLGSPGGAQEGPCSSATG